ncbi:hypothetical protein EYZ11_005066 [Aspergillus tanneri]|uniref:PAP-associated domain-containing protein n=1 Tax=Aspergillus tanneri TaxID=1220188 RepID=A0A4S3JJC1_9EURO|nr:uncharacterized protein ATNIH1004_006923 [Aspergillus tanneri]KAA8645504.1 hypothetical protein ATNIH1004_006923 [Aspergillus tanneri]THC95472.1 hypothetical protein EYZ11_005066 [Aspergillus tanneri]
MRRALHGTQIYLSDPTVFKNSLQRTLEAHRSSNRASLVRKVINRTPPKGIFRPEILSTWNTPNSQASEELSSAATPQSASPPNSTGARRKAGSLRQGTSVCTSQGVPSEQIQWAADAGNNRPEQSPWMDFLGPDYKYLDGVSQLDAEIRALEKYMSPKIHEQEYVDQVAAEIGRLLAGIVPRPPHLVGSWRTGLAMSHSDLEFVLPVPDSARSIERLRKPSATRPQVLDIYKNLLRDVENALRRCSSFGNRVHLHSRRSLVLTAIHGPTSMKLKFRCGEGLPPSVDYIRDYHAEYPSIRPLYVASRLILESRGLFGSHNLSIGSDVLVMLLVGFLKMNHGRFRMPNSLGEQLLAFLKFYGGTIDFTTTGISVDPPGSFNADTVEEASRAYHPEHIPAHLRGQRALINIKRTALARQNVLAASRLCLQDPANYMNDIGRACTRTREFQSAFLCAYNLIDASILDRETSNHGGPISSLLTHALQANFDGLSKVRARITSTVGGSIPTSTLGS